MNDERRESLWNEKTILDKKKNKNKNKKHWRHEAMATAAVAAAETARAPLLVGHIQRCHDPKKEPDHMVLSCFLWHVYDL